MREYTNFVAETFVVAVHFNVSFEPFIKWQWRPYGELAIIAAVFVMVFQNSFHLSFRSLPHHYFGNSLVIFIVAPILENIYSIVGNSVKTLNFTIPKLFQSDFRNGANFIEKVVKKFQQCCTHIFKCCTNILTMLVIVISIF